MAWAWPINWTRDRWHHVTLKGHTCDPNTLRARYLENGWRWRFRSNYRTTNRKWHDHSAWPIQVPKVLWWPWPSFRGRTRIKVMLTIALHWTFDSPLPCVYIWKPLEIEAWFQTTTIGNDIWAIEWSRDRWRHVTLKGQTRDPKYA